MSLTLHVFPEADVPPLLQAQGEMILNTIWKPPEGLSSWTAHEPLANPTSMFMLDGDEVVATLEVLTLPLEYAGTSFIASGLSRVRTLPERQGEGIGLQLVRASYDLMRDAGSDLAIFTCDTPLHVFYELAGFERLVGTVLEGGSPGFPYPSDQPGFDKAVMAAFYTPHAQSFSDAFQHARIPLHPGEIDLLW